MIENPSKEISRMFEVEYGDRIEVSIRLAGVALGALLLHFFLGWQYISLVWAILYIASHAAQYHFLKTHLESAESYHIRVANLLFIVVLLCFLWLPTVLAMQTLASLAYAGLTLVAAVVSFLIKRADSDPWMVATQLGVVWAAFMCILVSKLISIHDLPSRIALVIVSLAVVGYISKTLFAAGKLRLAAEEAASRAAQESKMAAIGQLAGGVAHDFNNALTVILGNIELHEVLDEPSEKAAALSEANAAALRAKDTVRQLLIFAHKAPSFRKPVHIEEAVVTLIELSERLVPENIRVCPAIEPDLPAIWLDEAQTLTVLVNLLTNAADAMPGGGTLIISCKTVCTRHDISLADGIGLDPGTYVQIAFRDTGKGISPEIRDRVTEPFFTTKDPGAGTGLGLSMASAFARENGGGLSIQSVPGDTEIALLFKPGSVTKSFHSRASIAQQDQRAHLAEDNRAKAM